MLILVLRLRSAKKSSFSMLLGMILKICDRGSTLTLRSFGLLNERGSASY